ncbi:hypothetical protein [Nocardia sp. NPDC060259]|uniref:hypothetical protein n=1 Tax=Nocardia sp. NPDC060259 TaxID=3347088 RepID=UPI00365FC98A
MSEREQRTACRATAVEGEYLDRRQIAREIELNVHFLDFLKVPLRQWAGLGRWATLEPATRSDVGTHALATLDTVLADLIAVRARLAATVESAPDDVGPGTLVPLPEHGGLGWAVVRAFERFVAPTRFISISLNQWAARTSDDYSDEARTLAGERALGFLDNALAQLVPIREVLAADLGERPTGDPA